MSVCLCVCDLFSPFIYADEILFRFFNYFSNRLDKRDVTGRFAAHLIALGKNMISCVCLSIILLFLKGVEVEKPNHIYVLISIF